VADLVVRGGLVVDATGTRRADVVVRGGVVTDVAPTVECPPRAEVLDAGGCVVVPGLVDLHAHLREPGGELAETVESGARAAALGGYTAVVAMPNTDPVVDSAAVVRHVLDLGEAAPVDVVPAGAITVGQKGKLLAPMAEMAELGVRIFTDDGTGVQEARLMRRALEYASTLDVTLAQHCQEATLSEGGHMHEGEWSSRLGICGVPAAAEELMVERDVRLSALTGAPVHMLHLSTAGSVDLVRRAKGSGQRVTAEVCPHHLVLTDADVQGYDPVFKVNPPLRSWPEVQALRAGLADGTIDAIATDHAPHTDEAKEKPFDEAPPGMTGLETALAVVLTELCQEDPDGGPRGSADRARHLLDLQAAVGLMSWRPAEIARLRGGHGGPIAAGSSANLCVVDPAETWVVDPERMASRSRNTPFARRELRGRVRHTVYRGEPVVRDWELQR
jgi:dihydroorotase